jgi:hypothetical protein
MYVLLAGLFAGVIMDPPFLLVMGLLMIAAAFYLHWPTVRNLIKQFNGSPAS